MSKFVLGDPPYYNQFDASKNYSSVLFRPGMVVQTQELNELQSILKQQIRNIGGVLLSDGDIIEGCQLIITDMEDNSVAKRCTVTEGKIYFSGNIYSVDTTELTLKGTGTELIGVKEVDEVITEAEDPSLLDNSAGYANAQMSGAHRQKTYAEIVLDDDSASTIYTIFDGVAVNAAEDDSSETTILNNINTTLARRTYDESGNYRVDGLQMSAKGTSNDDYINLNISAGKAYVQGYELSRNSATTLPLARAKDLRNVDIESQEYIDGESDYPLNNSPAITDGLAVLAYIEATTNITKGVVGGSDPFPAEYTVNSISTIERVWDSSREYEIGRNGDCYKNGNSIKWNEDANQPSNGSTYWVTFSYIRTLEFETDYELYTNDEGQSCIKILDNENSVKPIDGTNLMIEYNYMLYRRDLIVMDYLGNIKSITGQSDNLSTVATPVLSNDDYLILGSVLLTPLSDSLTIINNTNKRLSMNELQNMSNRLSNVEENIAISDLDNEAMSGEDATLLAGVYTDGFIGLTKCDVDHELFNCAIDLDNQELTLSAAETLHILSVEDRTNVSPVSAYSEYKSLLTAPATETAIVSISDATGVRAVNPYAVFSGMPTIDIDPRQNDWIDTETITVQGATVTKTVTLRRWWYHTNESWAEAEKAQYIALGFTDGGASLGKSNAEVTNTYSAVSSVLDTAIKYMQQITITVVGQMFDAYTDNIVVTFDGTQMSMTPDTSAYQGTSAGTLKADVNGYTKGSFVIPENTLCGTVEIQIYPYGDTKRIATTTFTSNGTLRTTTQVVWEEITKVSTYDPLAQTFQFDEDQFITGVGLYFCVNDTVSNVSIQLRGCDNGYPNATCYGEVILKPSDIKTSEDGTVETKIEFDDPIFCKKDTQYSIIVLTESDTDSVFYSELGGTDIRTGAQLLKNPYNAGMMFSSSNAMAWTAHQDSNLKINIYGNTFTEGYLYFGEITKVSYDRIMVMADVSEPDGTDLTWEYSTDNGFTWLPIVLFNDMELSELVTTILIRAHLQVTETTSPAILASSCYFIGFLNNTTCNYISRNVVMDDEFTHVKMKISVRDPENVNTSFALYYATDTNGEEWHTPTQTGRKSLGSSWYQYTFEDDLDLPATNYRARVYMTTNKETSRPRFTDLMNIMN